MRALSFFKTLSWITLFSVILLVGVGSIVRSSGSGMGCPDWPKCFGKWIPPLHESELPHDLSHYYPHMDTPLPFNPLKTWTEYLNRLMGVTIGFLIIATFLSSLPLRTRSYTPIIWSGLAVLLVGFEGWLGAVVVKTNLKEWIITGHMAAAWLLIFTLQIARHAATTPSNQVHVPTIRKWIRLLFGATLIQTFLGTQVRHSVDPFIAQLTATLPRAQWAWQSGAWLWSHHIFSWIFLLSMCVYTYWVFQSRELPRSIQTLSYKLMGLVIMEMGVGIALAYGGLPPYLQPVHLVIATLIAASEFQLFLLSSKSTAY